MKQLFLLLLLVAPFWGVGQELSLYQAYWAMPEVHNPAYTGSSNCNKIGLTAKRQWWGIANAPNQQLLSAHLQLKIDKFKHQGIGLQVLNDRNGANTAIGARLAYAFQLMVHRGKGRWLGLALSAAGFRRQLDASNFMANSLNDQLIQPGSRSWNQFDIACGLLYQTRYCNIGCSAYQLVNEKSELDQAYTTPLLLIIHADAPIPITKKSSISPHSRIVYEQSQQQSADLGIRCLINKKYHLGVLGRVYRGAFQNYANTVILHLGYEYHAWTFGYSTDVGLTSLQKQHYASHELYIGFSICPKECSCTD